MMIKRFLAAVFAGFALFSASSCTAVHPAAPTANALLPTAEKHEKTSRETPPPTAIPGPALWKITNENTTIYLFGTVHALPKDKIWFDARIRKAFDAADEIVTEVDVSDAAQSRQALQDARMLPDGQSLRALMNADKRKAFEAALISLGLPIEALDQLKPWFAAMTLSLLPASQAGYQANSGVETVLSDQTGAKHRSALETIDEQIALFDALPQEDQLTFLYETIDQVPRANVSLDAMVAEWLKGDADRLAALLNAELTNPMLYARLLTERNDRWAEWIERRLETPGTVFIAVGAGHLAGQGSLQDQLQKRGIEVERIWQ